MELCGQRTLQHTNLTRLLGSNLRRLPYGNAVTSLVNIYNHYFNNTFLLPYYQED